MSGMFEPRSGATGKRDARYQKENREQKKTKKLALIITTAFVLIFAVAFTLNSAFIRRTLPAVSVGSVDFNVAEFQYFYNSERDDYVNTWMHEERPELLPEPGRSLASQRVSEEAGGTGETWADFFVSRTNETLGNLVAIYEAAAEAGFTFSDEEFEEHFDSTMASIEWNALMQGTTIDGLLQFWFGPAMNESIFRQIQEFDFIVSAYSRHVHESFEYSSEELRQYFDENIESLGERFGFDVNDYYMPSFRQILLVPEDIDPEEFDEGFADPEFVQTLELAQEELTVRADLVYSLFIEAGSTEEALLSLMEAHTDDTTEGGFYENISKEPYNSMTISTMRVVDEIHEWLFDENREVGDFEMIYTEFGYHLVYFTGLGDTFHNVIAEDVADRSMRASDYEEWLESLDAPEAIRRFAFFFVQT